jgi:hypothetical protein
MKFGLLLPPVFLFLFFIQCMRKDSSKWIEGTWKIDSIYTYYNGYGFTRHDVHEEPVHHYQPDGRLRMTKEKEFRFFFYDLPDEDTLVYRKLDKEMLEKFFIVKIDQRQLVLRKERPPVFGGGNQERYEIKYFSKVKF